MIRSLFFRCLILISAWAISSEGVSQGQFLPGFIVKKDGDTVHGYIKEDSHIGYAKEITFSRNKSGGQRAEYTPEGLDAYNIEDIGFFKSKKVDYIEAMQDPNSQISGVSYSADTVNDQRRFLLVLESGMATLYYFRSSNDNIHYFLEKPDMEITELRQVKQVIHGSREIELHKKDLYKGVLKYAFQDCRKGSPEDNVSLNQRSLVKAVRAYNECMRSQGEYDPVKGIPEIHYVKGKTKWEISVLGGYSMIWYFPDNNDVNKDKYSVLNAFSGGASAALNPPSWSDKVWLEFRVLYSPKGYLRAAYTKPPPVPGYPSIQYPESKVINGIMQAGVFARYETNPSGMISPFICGGISLGNYIIPELDLGIDLNLGTVTPFILIRNEFVGAVPFLKYYVLNFSAGIRF